MPRIHFTVDYTAIPHPAQAVAYKAGRIYLVSQAVAADVIRRNRGYQVPSPGEHASEPDMGGKLPRGNDAGG